MIDYTGTDNADYWHLQDHGNCHLHPSPALRDGQDGLQGIPGHPPMKGISSRIFLVYNFTAYDHQRTGPQQVVWNRLFRQAGCGDGFR